MCSDGGGRSDIWVATMLLPSPTGPWQVAQVMSNRLRPSSSSWRVTGSGMVFAYDGTRSPLAAIWPVSPSRPVVSTGFIVMRSRGTVPSGGARIDSPSSKKTLSVYAWTRGWRSAIGSRMFSSQATADSSGSTPHSAKTSDRRRLDDVATSSLRLRDGLDLDGAGAAHVGGDLLGICRPRAPRPTGRNRRSTRARRSPPRRPGDTAWAGPRARRSRRTTSCRPATPPART